MDNLPFRPPAAPGAAALLLGIALLTASAARAQAPCEQYSSAYDRTYCISKHFIESDRELGEVYQALRAQLKNDTRQRLTQVQRDWITHRNQSCQPTENSVNVECNYRINRERTEYLRARLRECKTGSCRIDLITRPHWQTPAPEPPRPHASAA